MYVCMYSFIYLFIYLCIYLFVYIKYYIIHIDIYIYPICINPLGYSCITHKAKRSARLCAVSEVLGFFPLELPCWDIPGGSKEDGMVF